MGLLEAMKNLETVQTGAVAKIIPNVEPPEWNWEY
jgi:hypothetical protein